jgi:hypothetical protein
MYEKPINHVTITLYPTTTNLCNHTARNVTIDTHRGWGPHVAESKYRTLGSTMSFSAGRVEHMVWLWTSNRKVQGFMLPSTTKMRPTFIAIMSFLHVRQ